LITLLIIKKKQKKKIAELSKKWNEEKIRFKDLAEEVDEIIKVDLKRYLEELPLVSAKIEEFVENSSKILDSIPFTIGKQNSQQFKKLHYDIEEKIELLFILPLKLIKDKGRELLEEGEKVYKKLLEIQPEESLYSFTEYEKEWKEWKKRSEIILEEEIEIRELKIKKDLMQKEKEELKEIITQNEIKYKEVKRMKVLKDVLSIYSEIPLIKLQQMLDFAELQDLEKWLLDLSSVSIKIEEDKLIISEKASKELTQSIDELIKRFSEWEKTGKGKKN